MSVRQVIARVWALALCVVAAVSMGAATPPGARAASPWLGLVANNQYPFDTVSTFDPQAEAAGPGISVGGDNLWVGVAPDGSAAYVDSVYPSPQFDVVDLSTKSIISAPPLPNGNFAWGAVSPDGTHAYLSGGGELLPIDLTTSTPTIGSAISIPDATDVAYSPDGKTLWVLTGTDGHAPSGVVPVNTATNAIGTQIATGADALGVAMSPDGRFVWVANHDAQTVSKISTTSNQVVATIPISAGHPIYVAVSPDGSRVWVSLQAEHKLTWINTSDDSVGTALDTGGVEARGLAVTPDGKTVFVTDGTLDATGRGSQVTPVDATTSPPTAKTPITGLVDPVWEAITPDQAPVADFTVEPQQPGSPARFDASSSLAPGAPIGSYRWTFGDGASVTTSVPTVTHTYTKTGTYQATLVETDSAGTSVTPVYTGHQVVRNGGPTASATKSVVVSNAPPPAVKLSASQLSFGTVGVGKMSPEQAVTVTDSGAGTLDIARTSITGTNGRDFKLLADTCAHTSVAPGATCTARVAMAPAATGPRSARLEFVDDASGSPHVVFLDGSGTNNALLTGTVRNDAGRPVAGADVSVCTYSSRNVCRSDVTGADGTYSVTGLPADRYQVEVLPGGGSLFPASAVLDLPIGSTSRDFVLLAPTPIPAGLTFNGSGNGTPTGFWKDAQVVDAPLYVMPQSPGPGAYGLSVAYFTASSNTSNGDDAATAAITVIYRFDSAGVPRFVALNDGAPFTEARYPPHAGLLGKWTLGLTTAPQPGADVRGLSLQGMLSPPAAGPFFHGGASYSVDQFVTADLPAGAARDAHIAQFTCQRTKPRTKDLGPGTHVMPHGTRWPNGTFTPTTGPYKGHTMIPTGKTAKDQSGQNDLSVFYDPKTGKYWVTDGDTGDIIPAQKPADYTPPASSSSTSTTATYSGGYQNLNGGSGETSGATLDSSVHLEWTDAQGNVHTAGAPKQASDGPRADGNRIAVVAEADSGCPCQHGGGSGSFDAYHDPSGLVVTTRGVEVPGARVVLLRAARRHARPRPVRNGSNVMSPANRRNPDRTDLLGHFGWDVLTGFYKVIATHAGCHAARGRAAAASTGVFAVPPPVDNLRLVLACPHLRRLRTRTVVSGRVVPVKQVVLRARVAGRGSATHRVGTVLFQIGRQRLSVPVNPRTAIATITIRAPRRRTRIRASYRGNGLYGPSSGTTTVR